MKRSVVDYFQYKNVNSSKILGSTKIIADISLIRMTGFN